MKNIFIYKKGDITVYQPNEYMEDGWYITQDKIVRNYVLWEIPQYGGEANIVDNFLDLMEAIEAGERLC